MHPRQRPLEPEIEAVWLAALGDAAVAPDDALLYVLDGESGGGFGARYLYKHMHIRRDDEPQELHPLLDELNRRDNIDAYRVAVFRDRSIEGIAALLRHELEHARQRDVHGQRLMELNGVAEEVIRERVGGLAGGAFLYQVLPLEMDANAAGAQFVRSHFGAERIDELLRARDPDGAAFRSLVGPPPIETLPERTLLFLAAVPDLCELYAQRSGFAFETLLDLHWRGAGAIWRRFQEDAGLKLRR